MTRLVTFLGLMTFVLSGCSRARTATVPTPREVSTVVVSDVWHSEDPPIATISDPAKIAAALNFLEQRKSGWKPVRFTPPAGRLNILFYNGSEFVAVVRAYHNRLQMPIGGSECSLEIDDMEQNGLFEILGLDPAILQSGRASLRPRGQSSFAIPPQCSQDEEAESNPATASRRGPLTPLTYRYVGDQRIRWPLILRSASD
jgi:hypothetical protein